MATPEEIARDIVIVLIQDGRIAPRDNRVDKASESFVEMLCIAYEQVYRTVVKAAREYNTDGQDRQGEDMA